MSATHSIARVVLVYETDVFTWPRMGICYPMKAACTITGSFPPRFTANSIAAILDHNLNTASRD